MTLKDDQIDLLRDGFAYDMALHQREVRGELPTPEANAALAAQTLEQLEQQWSDEERKAKLAAAPKPVEKDPSETPPITTEKAEREGWKLWRPEEREVELPMDLLTLEFAERLNARVEFLLTKEERGPLNTPSWQDRVLSAYRTYTHYRNQGVPRSRNPGLMELIQICEDSNRVFYDWKKDPPKVLYGHG